MRHILLVLFLVMCWCPCAHANSLNVVTTTADLKAVVEAIGKEHVKVISLGKGNQNYHFLQAKPSYMIKAKRADLFIRNGLDLEIGYESLILQGSRNKKIQPGNMGHLDASDVIHALDVPDHVDRSMGDIHAAGNPHYWLDPLNMRKVARSITNRLSHLAPEYEREFEQNFEEFSNQIDAGMKRWKNKLSPYQGEKLITYHSSWSYFANRFGFEVIETLEPKPGVPPSPSHLKEVVLSANSDDVKIILTENIYKIKPAKYVADRSSALSIASPISVGGDSYSKDYIQLMDRIVDLVEEGFSRQEGNS